ncbi:MAG: phospholipid/cholesterol/gamma-HCH transport system substrate-binding protein, partial [Alphaproteobacteria bacterium]
MTQKFEAFIGLCVILAAATFMYALMQVNAYSLSNQFYPVKAYFNNISGITTGSEVKMSGVKIGSVTATNLDAKNYRAELVLSINDNIKLPVDSVVKIASDSLLGGASINIEAGFEEQ